MKQTLVAGDTLDFLTTVADYPATDGWTLKFRLVPRDAAGAPIVITAGAAGDDYRTQIGPEVTATYAAADYSWTSWVEKSGARYGVDQGIVTVLPDPATVAPGYDNRSHARKVLEAIEAVIEKRATHGQAETEVHTSAGSRRLRHMTVEELFVLRDRYAAMVRAEDQAEQARLGYRVPTKLMVRF